MDKTDQQLLALIRQLDNQSGDIEGSLDDLTSRVTALEAVISSSGPILYQQPTDITVADGEDAVFSVRVIGSGLTYLWELYYGSNWITTNYDGVHTPDLTVPGSSSTNGYKFRCTITGGGWTIYSKTVTLHVT